MNLWLTLSHTHIIFYFLNCFFHQLDLFFFFFIKLGFWKSLREHLTFHWGKPQQTNGQGWFPFSTSWWTCRSSQRKATTALFIRETYVILSRPKFLPRPVKAAPWCTVVPSQSKLCVWRTERSPSTQQTQKKLLDFRLDGQINKPNTSYLFIEERKECKQEMRWKVSLKKLCALFRRSTLTLTNKNSQHAVRREREREGGQG